MAKESKKSRKKRKALRGGQGSPISLFVRGQIEAEKYFKLQKGVDSDSYQKKLKKLQNNLK